MTGGERKELHSNLEENRGMQATLKAYCHHEVWDTPDIESAKADPEVLDTFQEFDQLTRDRGESCFFYPHSPWMSLPAGTEVERRADDRREAEKDRALTRKAFLVAAIALVVSIVATVASIIIQLLGTNGKA